MSWGIPSGNHLLRIRPSWQDIQGNKTTWGDENQDAGEDWVSIIWNKDQDYWVAGCNPGAVRTFLGAVTGTARMEGSDLMVYIDKESSRLVFHQYKSGGDSVARLKGNVFRFTMTGRTGGQHYQRRTRFVRQVDMGIITPPERLTEMLDAVLKDEDFGAYLRKEFGALGRAEVLVAIAVVLALFAGIVGGAAAVGGAAFGAAVGRLLGVSLMATQLKVYVDAFGQLQNACFSNDQRDFERGKTAVRTIIRQLLMDVCMALGLGAAAKAGAKVWGVLKGLFTKFTPTKWQEAAQQAVVAAKQKVNAAGARFKLAREDLFSVVGKPSVVFRAGEDKVLRARAAANGEMIAIRGPSPERLRWLKQLNGWLDGKPEWVKVKSWMGWHGLVGFPKSAEIDAVVQAGAKSTYPMGNLKGVFKEVDDYIAKNPNRPAYEVPYGKNFVDPVKGKKCFDWDAAGANYSLAKGAKLVDIGDRYILVDALGRPICQDLDLAAIYKLGTASPGAHMPAPIQGPKAKGATMPNPEDWFGGEELLNYQMFQATGQTANMMKHGGRGGSMRHIIESIKNGTGFWSPLEKNGTWLDEPIYAYIPTGTGINKTAELFKFKGWAEFEKFCEANHFEVGFKELRAAVGVSK